MGGFKKKKEEVFKKRRVVKKGRRVFKKGRGGFKKIHERVQKKGGEGR